MDYVVTIHLAKVSSSDFIRQIKYFTLIGDRGNSGKRPFIFCGEEGRHVLDLEKFHITDHKKQQIRFHVRAVDIGQLDQIKIELSDVDGKAIIWPC